MFFNNNAPISDVYLQMARFIGCKEIIETLYHFQINETVGNLFKEKLRSEFADVFDLPMILINPNSSDLRIERRWPSENFALLICELSSLFKDFRFGLIGANDETNYIKKIIDKIPNVTKENIIDFSGKCNLSELILLIGQSAIFITNDSGPMHIALAMNKTTIALFGPHYFPNHGNNEKFFSLYKNLYCSPCVHEFLRPPCKGDNICMKQITVDEVRKLCVSLINKDTMANHCEHQNMIYSADNHPLGIIRR